MSLAIALVHTATVCVLLAVLASASAGLTNTSVPDLEARFMWGWGPGFSGYCGETSFQIHGLRFGNWISSDALRWNGAGSELLLESNARHAAVWAHFTFERWKYSANSTPSTSGSTSKHEESSMTFPESYYFLNTFVRPHIDAGHTTIIGVFELKPDGDLDYDHIVPVVSYTANSTSSSTVPGTVQQVAIYDLYLLTQRAIGVATREAMTSTAQPAQPYSYAVTEGPCYGIALTGVRDDDGELFRVTLDVPSWYEPDYSAEDGKHEEPVAWNATATASGLTPGVTYSLLRFNDASVVPDSNFLAGAYAWRIDFTPDSSDYSLVVPIYSDATVFFRCVVSDAQVTPSPSPDNDGDGGPSNTVLVAVYSAAAVAAVLAVASVTCVVKIVVFGKRRARHAPDEAEYSDVRSGADDTARQSGDRRRSASGANSSGSVAGSRSGGGPVLGEQQEMRLPVAADPHTPLV